MRDVKLLTERLLLVPNSTVYADAVHKYAGDAENCKYMAFLPNKDMAETVEFLQHCENEWQKDAPTFYEFAVIMDGEMIGGVSADVDEECQESELGWVIQKKYWGHGIVPEAAKKVMEFVTKERGITHFYANCDSENRGSYRVMEKLGMSLTKQTFGRKNRISDELRMNSRYDLYQHNMSEERLV